MLKDLMPGEYADQKMVIMDECVHKGPEYKSVLNQMSRGDFLYLRNYDSEGGYEMVFYNYLYAAHDGYKGTFDAYEKEFKHRYHRKQFLDSFLLNSFTLAEETEVGADFLGVYQQVWIKRLGMDRLSTGKVNTVIYNNPRLYTLELFSLNVESVYRVKMSKPSMIHLYSLYKKGEVTMEDLSKYFDKNEVGDVQIKYGHIHIKSMEKGKPYKSLPEHENVSKGLNFIDSEVDQVPYKFGTTGHKVYQGKKREKIKFDRVR